MHIFGKNLINMKKYLFLLFSFLTFSIYSQISEKGLPPSFINNIDNKIENISFEKPAMEEIILEDNTKEKDRYRYGVRINTDIDINKDIYLLAWYCPFVDLTKKIKIAPIVGNKIKDDKIGKFII